MKRLVIAVSGFIVLSPVGERLASTTIPASAVSAVGPIPGSLVTGVFSDPATVEAGQQYALVLKTTSSANYAVAISTTEVGSPYEGGMMRYQFDPFGEFGAPSEWFSGESIDMIFAIYVTQPDTTPSEVSLTRPPNDATGVSATANIRATFSEDMRPASVMNAFKLLKKGSTNQIDAQVSYDAATDIATLNSDNNLMRGVTYKAVLTTVAKDEAGNRLDQDDSRAGLQQKVWFFEID